MLSGKAKKDYQREYMRRYRSNKKAVRPRQSVRPKEISIAQIKQAKEVLEKNQTPEPQYKSNLAPDGHPKQSYNPAMVGYVPPAPKK
jgi:hypothetical protein